MGRNLSFVLHHRQHMQRSGRESQAISCVLFFKRDTVLLLTHHVLIMIELHLSETHRFTSSSFRSPRSRNRWSCTHAQSAVSATEFDAALRNFVGRDSLSARDAQWAHKFVFTVARALASQVMAHWVSSQMRERSF